jgi:REP element-mobilizing transposase RayT
MSGILRNDGVFPLSVGGWKDHVHVFFELPPSIRGSDLIRDLKVISSK